MVGKVQKPNVMFRMLERILVLQNKAVIGAKGLVSGRVGGRTYGRTVIAGGPLFSPARDLVVSRNEQLRGKSRGDTL